MRAGTDQDDRSRRRFNALAGRWRLSRQITGGSVGRMTGIASFEACGPDCLAYAEAGQLILPGGQVLDVFRRYAYRLLADGRIAIDFADGPTPGARFVTFDFVTLDFATGDPPGAVLATDIHHCGDDVYHATIALDLPERFSTDIRVTGPRKDYRAHTQCRRLADAS